MKKLLLLLFVAFSVSVFSQDYKQKIVKDMCSRLERLDAARMTKKRLELEFGLILFKSALPYKKEIKKDMGIDFSEDISDKKKMQNFGKDFGILVATHCPDVFIKALPEETLSEISSEDSSPVTLVSGKVVKIEKGNFVTFYIKGDNGILHPYHWVGMVESNIDLPKEYKNLIHKKVFIGYHQNTIFDADKNAYQTINEIHRLMVD